MTLIALSEITDLIKELETIVRELRQRNRIEDSREVDEFFYLYKIEELKFLTSKIETAQLGIVKLNGQVSKNVNHICRVLKKDLQHLKLSQNTDLCRRFQD